MKERDLFKAKSTKNAENKFSEDGVAQKGV
jgi:hypothetical protein